MKQDQFTPSLILFLVSFLVLASTPAFAGEGERRTERKETKREQERYSDPQSFDKRLPPVLPGAEIYQGGKKIRVITTSGPVPVQAAPQAPKAPEVPQQNNSQGKISADQISVIVDSREQVERDIRSLGQARMNAESESFLDEDADR